MSKDEGIIKDKTEYIKLFISYTFLCLVALFLLYIEYKRIFHIEFWCFFIICGVLVFFLYNIKEKIIMCIDTVIELTGNKYVINFFVRFLFDFVIFGIMYFFSNTVSNNVVSVICKIIFKIIELLVMVIFTLRFIHFTIKYLLGISYIVAFLVVLLIYMIGWIESKSWQFIALIIVVVNMLLNYKDAQVIYVDIKNKLCPNINFYKSKQEHKIKFLYLKLKFNIAVIFLYVYIILTKNINIFGKLLLDEFKDDEYYAFIKFFLKGSDRVFCILVIALIVVLIFKIEFVRKKYDRVLDKLRKYYVKAFDEITGQTSKNCFKERQAVLDKKM